MQTTQKGEFCAPAGCPTDLTAARRVLHVTQLGRQLVACEHCIENTVWGESASRNQKLNSPPLSCLFSPTLM